MKKNLDSAIEYPGVGSAVFIGHKVLIGILFPADLHNIGHGYTSKRMPALAAGAREIVFPGRIRLDFEPAITGPAVDRLMITARLPWSIIRLIYLSNA